MYSIMLAFAASMVAVLEGDAPENNLRMKNIDGARESKVWQGQNEGLVIL